jgi:hypothetical protein
MNITVAFAKVFLSFLVPALFSCLPYLLELILDESRKKFGKSWGLPRDTSPIDYEAIAKHISIHI